MANQTGQPSVLWCKYWKSSIGKVDLTVPFPSPQEAEIAYNTLRVDPEPKRGGCKKTLSVQENNLQVNFVAQDARGLRVAVNSFFDHLNLVVRTIDQFGPPLPRE